jgi:hypothetical protein
MTDRLSNDYADQIACLKQERDARDRCIAELEVLLEGRDDFIVSCGLWQSFVDGLPAPQHDDHD